MQVNKGSIGIAGFTSKKPLVFRMNLPTKNGSLGFVKSGWSGNPVKNNRYENHEFPFTPEFLKLLKWQREPNPEKLLKKNTPFISAEPVEAFLTSKEDGICWIGHATFFIRLGGILLITDPVFGSPSRMMKRLSALPFSRFPGADLLLISHDHRDHTDEQSLIQIGAKSPRIPVFTGLNMTSLLRGFIPQAQIVEMGWYQQALFENLTITFLPSRHWSRRGLLDTKKRLWGAFFVSDGKKSVYFGGDSGYGSHFSEVRSLFGPPSVSIIGIGAYKPQWFMGSSHTSPQDAWRAAKETGCWIFIPMHFGTFDLADEPVDDPAKRVQELANQDPAGPALVIPVPGRPVYF